MSLLSRSFALLLALVLPASASVVINEIMFHPPGAVEPREQEWLELYNAGSASVDLSGWKLTRGVTFTVPTGTQIAAGGFLIVAADVAAFHAAHPGFAGQVVGGWTGRLSNSGEELQLDNAAGTKICDVTYADEGDWALRGRGEVSFLHQGWEWFNAADGEGRTLELRNPLLGIGSGQNWGVSAAEGGSPGAANSLASQDVPPLIKDAKHRPEIPRSTEPIVVSCELEDEIGATATLFWRLDGGTWQAAPMSDADGDSDVEATIPAQANLAVVEWYISATDGTATRTWPAPARTSDPGILPETFAQATNALLQVDDAFNPAATFRAAADQPIYRLVMTEAERAELAQIGSTSDHEQSEATMNGTFISHDGTGVRVRYLCGFRNRGMGSALGPPNNYHVGFRSDARWSDRLSFALNCQYTYSQALGQALSARAGIPTQDAALVKVRVNGLDLAETGGRMYGRYVRIEGRNAEWAENHFPNDPDGNFYRLDDHAEGAVDEPPGNLGSGEFRYEGEDGAAYADTFIKDTNAAAADFSDLIQLTRIVSAPITGGTAAQPAISNADYPTAVAAVLDLDNFYRYIATDALLGNQEGGLQSGRGDDASIYAGVIDPRFRFIPHDLDDVFDIGTGSGSPVTRSLFSYDGGTSPGTGMAGLTRLFNHPQLVPRYYAAVLEAIDAWFNHATIDPIIDQLMAGWVPATDGNPSAPNRGIAEIKNYIDTRTANVLGQIQQNYSLAVTGNAADTPEGYKVTTTGAAVFSGTFNVARTYSITVNGQLATWNYRSAGATVAGTWSLNVPAGGGNVLRPGFNKVVVRFWDGSNGTGNVLREFTSDVVFSAVAGGTTVSGTLAPPGLLEMTAPASYVPGVPVLVRVDLKDLGGTLNRALWNSTVNLTATNGVTLTPATVTLFNGVGSALVTVGTGAGNTVTIFSYGTGGTGSTSVTGSPGAQWRAKTDLTTTTIGSIPASWKDEGFDDSSWPLLWTQTGYGNNDENQAFPIVDYNASSSGTQRGPSYLFRNTFQVADVTQLSSMTGQIKYDDAYAIFINGTRIARSSNQPLDAPLTSYATGTSSDNATANFSVPLGLLKNGTNTIAVEIRQANSTSSDVTFDLRMQAQLSAADPGTFTLTASTTGLSASKAIASLFGTTPTTVSGTLPAGTTNWTGVVSVTGDVTVPVGATLTIEPGTHVLMNGTGTAGDTTGADLIVAGGTLAVNGTAAQPVSITSHDANGRWGQIYLNGAEPTIATHLLMSRGGHAPGQGHTGRGPMWRLNGADLSLLDSAMGDGPAKALYSQGTCDLVIQRSLLARMITGPETGDGASVLIEGSNIQEILPHYRESNAAVPDDEDCLYIHNSSGRPVIVRRSVFARCGDDVFDGLGGPLVVEDCILREGWDKGMSLLNNDLTISRTLIVDCDKAIVPKSSTAATRTVVADRCTIVSENHDTTLAPWGYSIPPSSPDADTPSTGIYTQDKSGQSHADAILANTVTNSIILAEFPILIDPLYPASGTVVNYSITRDTDTPAEPAWPGIGNSNADPLFVSLAADNFHLAAGSPAIDAGDPVAVDPDDSRADMGALPSGAVAGGGGASELVWSPAGGPYRLVANTTVPPNLTLRVQPGVSVYFDKGVRLTVNGRILAEGTAGQRIVFSHVPGTIDAGDCDPIKNGVQTGAPKWGGIRVYDSMAEENVFRYCDFINAQGTSPSGSENYGSVGFVRSWGWVDHCTWSGSHLRWCYGRNSKMTVTRNVFSDMFLFDPVLGRIENPTDFLASADNNQEPLKNEYPTTDAQVAGNPDFPNGQPFGGHFRVWFNDFHGNRGHNDVFDADSGRWGQPGQFMLDCRYNNFLGLSGDEHIDLGGDAYIASNVFTRATKDEWTSDTGYSNAISSGDKGSGTTIMVVRNVFYDLDHAINCKAGTATIFEHNTVANFHADYSYTFFTPAQDVKCAPINFFIPEDGSNPTYGDGAYLGFNLISNVPRLFSGADSRKVSGNVVHDVTTKIEFHHNLLDQIADPTLGPNHPGGLFDGSYGPNSAGAPGFVDAANGDFTLRAESPARGTAPGGFDYGASVAEWAHILAGPRGTTAAATATFTIAGPGIVAFKWRLDGGAWSAPIQIGDGGLLPRATPTQRQATLLLENLAPGAHTLEVLGQDMAGNWQDADPARTLAGLPQAEATVRSWTVQPGFVAVRLSEILAASATFADSVELQNLDSAPVDLTGWSLSDDPLLPGKFPLSGLLAPGGFASFSGAGLALDRDGDSVRLYQNGVLRDAVVFGAQISDQTIGRHPATGEWALCAPTPGAANTPVPTGDFRSVRLCEWLASGDVLYADDWLELQNTAAVPALLTGLRVTTNRAGDASAFTFPPLSFIAAGGYLRLTADESAEPGHLPFRLEAEAGILSLLDTTGAVLDAVTYYPQTTDWSMGRDGAGLLTYFELPTRGFANDTTGGNYANALALLRGLRITEIMFNATGGNDYEFVELRNIGATAFDLAGVTFVNGIDFTFGTYVLQPGAEVVVVKNLVRFRERYGSEPQVAGVYSGNLDNSGEGLALQLPPPFDARILAFDFRDDWQALADGFGKSLEIRLPLAAASAWDERETWQESISLFGSPGGVLIRMPDRLATWTSYFAVPGPLSDFDADGLLALTEFALGSDPNDPNGDHGAAGAPALSRTTDGHARLHLLLPEHPAAAQGHGQPEITYTVFAGPDPASWTPIASKTFGTAWSGPGSVAVGPAAGGYIPVEVTDPANAPTRFLKLEVTVTP